jgi:hypothetical protein
VSWITLLPENKAAMAVQQNDGGVGSAVTTKSCLRKCGVPHLRGLARQVLLFLEFD